MEDSRLKDSEVQEEYIDIMYLAMKQLEDKGLISKSPKGPALESYRFIIMDITE